jgi:hypothetical protein
MRTKFQLATGPLSYLKEVVIDLELKGKHFDDLAVANVEDYERVVCSVLKDLMDEDPFQLTYQELYHLFLLAKVTSLGPKIRVNIRCRSMLHSRDVFGDQGRECGAMNPYEYSLLDSDVVYAPGDYQFPEISFVMGGKEEAYVMRPPTMTHELDLFAYFQERGVSREALASDKVRSLEYLKHKILLYMRNKETGEGFFERKRMEEAVKAMSENPLSFISKATDIIAEEESFGVSHQRLVLTCKECGGKINFRLPFSSGLSL